MNAAYSSLLQRGRMLPDKHQTALVHRLTLLQQQLSPTHKAQEALRGVYIHGGVGTGKTRLVDLFYSTLPASTPRRRAHFNEFMLDIHSRLHIARSQSTYNGDPLIQIGLQVAKESRVLCFDEFQVTDIVDAMILRRLFGAVWSAGGVLVSTSNRPPDNLYENGLNRDLFLPFIGALKRHCEIWPFDGQEDYRVKNRGDDSSMIDTFFVDPELFDKDLREKLSTFGQLTPHRIEVVGGRNFDIPGTETRDGGLLVSTTFEHLCKADRGASDFIALCNRARTIYITGLRQFASDELDIVRRFITLVDLAYEKRVRIVCLSQVPLLQVFSNIVAPAEMPHTAHVASKNITVRREGGASSSMASTFIGEMEWSATGLHGKSLATGGAGETDVRFAIRRAVSRLVEMSSSVYTTLD